MNPVKAIVLCNNPIAIPAIREFLFLGNVGAVVIPARNREMEDILTGLLQGSGVPLLKADNKNLQETVTTAIEQYGVNTGLVMTFPYKIPSALLTLPAKGFLNFHFGLLPQRRGPQPILWHLLKNDTEAGVTIHVMDNGIDTGPIVMQEKMPIDIKDTYGLLQNKLAYLGAKLGANLLKILNYGTMIPSSPQDESLAEYLDMPTSADLTIQWKTMEAAQIIRLINACNPWNKAAGTAIKNWFIGITEAELAGTSQPGEEKEPGTILSCDKQNGLLVQALAGQILKINIIYTQEGFFSGYRLMDFGLQAGDTFN
ncbi:MAG: hypothetical protein IPP93_15005 [Chitinophagaceae bacterium]|nr:hypothetical protein [Chitinophagaceae bacterium]